MPKTDKKQSPAARMVNWSTGIVGRTFNPFEINADAFTRNGPEKLIREGDMIRMITVTVDHRRMAEPY